jgi:hypothetical protein
VSIKGFFSIFKGSQEQPDYATLQPVQRGQFALDVVARSYMQVIGSDAVEAGSTTRVIAATAHSAKRGDAISFTSGALQTREVGVQETTANTITLCEVMESAPAAAVTFDILRYKAPTVGAAGGLSIDTTGLATSAKQDTARQGRAYADSAHLAYSGTNVTSGAWVQLIAATAADINELMLDDSSGRALELGVGAAGFEARALIIPPGGFNAPLHLRIASGSRISLRAISTTASAGDIYLTGLN